MSEATIQKSQPDSIEAVKTRARIIDAAEELLRRHGPAKTKVVDVARHLKMSHANIYRHFGSKADIQDIIAARWLTGISGPLEEVVEGSGSAESRLREWVVQLVAIKERLVSEDPELFAIYNELAEASRGVIGEHVEHLRTQIAKIIAGGVASGEFKVRNLEAAAQAVHLSTSRFHHPYFVTREHERSEGMTAVIEFVIAGLKCGVV